MSLQPLPNTRTLIIINQKEPIEWENAELYLNAFLNKFCEEMKRLGFRETWYKKGWRIIKELLRIAQIEKP
jgi:hypothetical protein